MKDYDFSKKIIHYCDKFDDCPHKFRKFCCAESLPIHKVIDYCEVDKSYNYDKSEVEK